MSRQELREQWEQRVARRVSGQRPKRRSVGCCSWYSTASIALWLRKFSDDRPVERTSSVRWLSVQVDESPIPSTDTVVLHVSNVEIEIKPGFDPLLLRQVVQVLMTTCSPSGRPRDAYTWRVVPQICVSLSTDSLRSFRSSSNLTRSLHACSCSAIVSGISSRSRTRDHNGFWVHYRRLERVRFQWPIDDAGGTILVNRRQLR
ncbi:hypothetical protein SAMN05421799_1233 [Alicyclobacillus vulcanalis]|uniref:Uncharacterized protein n=1 Tax=Alicyclobacillus vulcanalis TaxID=252246 RepID=A0A1N7PWP0_9BACL|nr:hypothetical protein SAMN05421799_1233 [Alicyclobacillus vulcanalis]